MFRSCMKAFTTMKQICTHSLQLVLHNTVEPPLRQYKDIGPVNTCFAAEGEKHLLQQI